MKVFAVVLSLLTIFLSAYPCCQESDACMEISSISDCNGDRSSEDPHENETPCSPFYTCGRCPGFTLEYGDFAKIVTIEADLKTNPLHYRELIPKEVYFHRLKPPRTVEV